MNKYIIEIPLKHNTTSKLDEYSSYTSMQINLKSMQNLKLNINNENLNDEVNIQIENGNDNKVIVRFEDVYGKSENDAIMSLKPIIDKICSCISFIVQHENSNPHHFDIKFIYDINDCNVKCLSSNHSMLPRIISCGCDIMQTIDLEKLKFEEILNKSLSNKKYEFIIDGYYKSLGNIECESRYYNLFIIIEFLEKNYSSKIIYTPIFSIEQKKEFLGKIKNNLREIFQDGGVVNRLYSGVAQIISNVTMESRKEKLYRIITEYLGIKYIKICGEDLEVNIDMIDNFIKKRNGLVHAEHIDEKEQSEFNKTTNQLMILCGEIIEKLLEEI